jgi:hypothetical protein
MARLTGAWSLIPGARAWETVVDRHAGPSIQMFIRVGKGGSRRAIPRLASLARNDPLEHDLQVRQLLALVLRSATAVPGQLFG